MGQVVAEGSHDVVAVEQQAALDTEATVCKYPRRNGRLLAGRDAILPDVKDGRNGADRVGYIIGACGKENIKQVRNKC